MKVFLRIYKQSDTWPWETYIVDSMVIYTKKPTEYKGGPGSGHHGHPGRPGKRGGSLPGTGKTSIPAHIKFVVKNSASEDVFRQELVDNGIPPSHLRDVTIISDMPGDEHNNDWSECTEHWRELGYSGVWAYADWGKGTVHVQTAGGKTAGPLIHEIGHIYTIRTMPADRKLQLREGFERLFKWSDKRQSYSVKGGKGALRSYGLRDAGAYLEGGREGAWKEFAADVYRMHFGRKYWRSGEISQLESLFDSDLKEIFAE